MQKTPVCVGIIMDGNRRWAKAQGLPTLEGHRRGLDNLIECAKWLRDANVAHMAVFAFSTENWKRSEEEVSYLMDLLRVFIKDRIEELKKENVRIRFIGELERFSPDLQESMRTAEQETAHNSASTLWVCLSYGGRAEITAAAAKAAKEGVPITEASIEKYLWSAEMPDPDLIVRTSGEERLSGFLTWKSTYSELFFLEKMWPDITRDDLSRVLLEYAARDRRRGV